MSNSAWIEIFLFWISALAEYVIVQLIYSQTMTSAASNNAVPLMKENIFKWKCAAESGRTGGGEERGKKKSAFQI